MTRAVTERFEEMVLEISDDGVTWERIAGMTDVTITRTNSVDTAEIPDVDDESLPLAVERETRSQEVKASGSGVWAQQSHGKLHSWWSGGAAQHCRIGNLKAAAGEPEYETGKAILATLNHTRTKGQRVSAEIEIEFDGVPVVSNKAP